MSKISCDYLVIGGGIFGAYAAKILSAKGSVALIERESALLLRASRNNQTRVHSGLHYLRAPKTALGARKFRDRFLSEHDYAINGSYRHFYGIARHGSLTDRLGFERLAEWLDIEVKGPQSTSHFDERMIEAAYEVNEKSFDPFLIANAYEKSLRALKVSLYFGMKAVAAKNVGSSWRVEVASQTGDELLVDAKCVINATYSNTNEISKIFGLPQATIKHEYSELILAYIPSLENLAFTIMDGPFLSITPFGLTGLHVMSSVIYTHHSSTESSRGKLPCQVKNRVCDVDSFSRCQPCADKPASAKRIMINQARSFLPTIGALFVHGQLETVKSTWSGDDYRDERETSIRQLSSSPDFYTVLSGKVSSIYEMEGYLDGK